MFWLGIVDKDQVARELGAEAEPAQILEGQNLLSCDWWASSYVCVCVCHAEFERIPKASQMRQMLEKRRLIPSLPRMVG